MIDILTKARFYLVRTAICAISKLWPSESNKNWITIDCFRFYDK